MHYNIQGLSQTNKINFIEVHFSSLQQKLAVVGLSELWLPRGNAFLLNSLNVYNLSAAFC